MPKKFYTERDIEDLFARGIQSLEISDDVVLTELAFEKANRLGVKLVQSHQNPPSAPVRPYIAKESVGHPVTTEVSSTSIDEKLRQRVRDAVTARLGTQVDSVLLDTIIQRVLSNIKL
jgi:hypothetical protein